MIGSVTFENGVIAVRRHGYDESFVDIMRTVAAQYGHGKKFYREDGFAWKFSLEALPVLRKALPSGFAFDQTLEAAHSEYELSHAKTISMSKARDADGEYPHPPELDYFGFQKAGIAFLLSHPSTLLADEMGCGKTVEIVGLLNADHNIKQVLIVCPKSMSLVWQYELKRWLTRNMTIGIGDARSVPDYSDVVIVNYDVLRLHAKVRKEKRIQVADVGPFNRQWDLVIADECHKLKGKSQRAAVFFAIAKTVPRKAYLTGTPIVNRPIELYPLLRSLDPQRWGNWKAFVTRYCNAYQDGYGWRVDGASNLAELQDRLRGSLMIRRLREDVLPDLPPKLRQVIELPVEEEQQRFIDRENQTWQRHEAELIELEVNAELAKASDDPKTYEEAVKALRRGRQVAFTEMAKCRHDTALAKLPQVIEHLTEVLEDRKALCFAHHHDVVDALLGAFPGAAVLTGRETEKERQEAVQRFQNDEKCRLFIGSITAAGLGITLTAASHVVFAELDWVPGNISQCEDRAVRIGQTQNVLVQHLVLSGSLDATMAKRIVQKQEVIDKALDKEGEGSEILVPIYKATEQVRRADIEEGAKKITTEQILAVHKGLQWLSLCCDGAVALDGAGFSRIDTALGKSLAACQALTPRQAVLGMKLTIRHGRQLPAELLNTIRGKSNGNSSEVES